MKSSWIWFASGLTLVVAFALCISAVPTGGECLAAVKFGPPTETINRGLRLENGQFTLTGSDLALKWIAENTETLPSTSSVPPQQLLSLITDRLMPVGSAPLEIVQVDNTIISQCKGVRSPGSYKSGAERGVIRVDAFLSLDLTEFRDGTLRNPRFQDSKRYTLSSESPNSEQVSGSELASLMLALVNPKLLGDHQTKSKLPFLTPGPINLDAIPDGIMTSDLKQIISSKVLLPGPVRAWKYGSSILDTRGFRYLVRVLEKEQVVQTMIHYADTLWLRRPAVDGSEASRPFNLYVGRSYIGRGVGSRAQREEPEILACFSISPELLTQSGRFLILTSGDARTDSAGPRAPRFALSLHVL